VAIPKPLILNNADLLIDDTSLGCSVNHLELNPDVSEVTLTTFCGEIDYPGSVKWSLVATLYQSFDTAATEEVLSAAVEGGIPVTFEIIPDKSQPVSATNPSWTGEVIPQPYAPINGDAMAESTVEIEWSVVGTPTKNIVPPAGATTAAATEPAPAG